MAPKLCKYGCNTMLEGFDEEQRKFLEAGTGGLHTKERCQEAKAKLEAKNDHGNEAISPKQYYESKFGMSSGSETATAGRIITKDNYVDHTAKGQSKVKIFFGLPDDVTTEYNEFLRINNGRIKTQGAQFQLDAEGTFAIALYYEEVANQ